MVGCRHAASLAGPGRKTAKTWVLVVALLIQLCAVHLTSGCIVPEARTNYGDFAKRSDVVIRAQVVSTTRPNRFGRYNATFRVIGFFPGKRGDLSAGQTLHLGQFGRKPRCTPVKKLERFILFLSEHSDSQSELKGYSIRYNPVPLSKRNKYFFTRLIQGKISGKMFMKSGCRGLRIPRNGKLQYNSWRDVSRVVCNPGYVLNRKDSYRKCNILTGHWKPSVYIACIRPVAQLKQVPWTPGKRRILYTPSQEEEEEEEEEEEQEKPKYRKKYRKPYWKPSYRNPTSSKKPQRKPLGDEEHSARNSGTRSNSEEPNEEEAQDASVAYKKQKRVQTTTPPEETTEVNRGGLTTKTIKPTTTTTTSLTTARRPGIFVAQVRLSRPKSTVTTKAINPTSGKTSTPTTTEATTTTAETEAIRNTVTTTATTKKATTTEKATITLTTTATTTTKATTAKKLPTTSKTTTPLTTKTTKLVIALETRPNAMEPLSRLEKGKPQSSTSEETATTQLATVETGTTTYPPGETWINEQGLTYQPLQSMNGQVFGCPVYNGNVTVHSIWDGGFHANAIFPKLEHNIVGGWVLRVMFNVPVSDLETFTVEFLGAGHSQREFCFKPKHYTLDLYKPQDLTVGFNGKLPIGKIAFVEATAQLLGICKPGSLVDRKVGMMLPFDDQTSPIMDAWITDKAKLSALELEEADVWVPTAAVASVTANPSSDLAPPPVRNFKVPLRTNGKTTAAPPAQEAPEPGRCDKVLPNGIPAKGGEAETSWKRMETQDLQFDYNEVLHKSILFYEAQRSGKLPASNRIPWRGDADLKDGCSIKKDLSGGWYNGAGNVKTTFVIAYTTTVLAWGAIDYQDAYKAAGEWQNALDQIRWSAEYLIKCHTGKNELVVQVGNYVTPVQDWSRAEDSDPSMRKVYKVDAKHPGSDVAGEVSASLAAASILFKESDPSFASKCLKHAEELFNFGKDFRGGFSSVIPMNATKYYSYNGPNDELAWALVWLYKATGKKTYLILAERLYNSIALNEGDTFFWDDKTKGVMVLLAQLTGKSIYKKSVSAYMKRLQNTVYKIRNGMVWLDVRGPNMHAANAAFLAMQAWKIDFEESYVTFARGQMNILLGESGTGFVVGVGPHAPTKPYHRGSSCPSPPEPCTRSVLFTPKARNAHTLYGALVAGPGKFGRYSDSAGDKFYNGVAIDYNAGFQSLAAGLRSYDMRGTAVILKSGEGR